MMLKFALLCAAVIGLSGCTKYLLDIAPPGSPSDAKAVASAATSSTVATAPPSKEASADASAQTNKGETIGADVQKASIYTSVYAETDESGSAGQDASQSIVNACSSDFVADLLMDKQTNIALNAILPIS